jgi:hypothetical protein
MLKSIEVDLLAVVFGGSLTLTPRGGSNDDWNNNWADLLPRNQNNKGLDPLIDPSMTRTPLQPDIDPGMLQPAMSESSGSMDL